MIFESILYPFIAQAMISFFALFLLANRRIKAAKAGQTKLEYFKSFQGEGEPEIVRVAQRSFLNQFEMPVLFLAVCLASVVFQKESLIMVGLAWSYVIVRAAHVWVHVTSNKIMWRFRIFLFSNVILFAMWVVLAF